MAGWDGYITAYCPSCKKRVRHKIFEQRAAACDLASSMRAMYVRYAVCMVCGHDFLYKGKG